MKKKITVVFLAAFALFSLTGGKEARSDLHVYTWADYIKPELIERFETEHNCKVIIDTFDSNEAMYAKLKAGATGYDIITPSSYMVKMMHEQGMLQPLDKKLLPNLQHIDGDFLDISMDKELHHSAPYMITYVGIGYLKSKVKELKPTWNMLGRAQLKGRMTMLNDMRETIGAALKSLGYSLNTVHDKELAEARDLLIRWKKNLAKFESEQYKTGLASGEFFLVHGYSGDILKVQEENDDIEFMIPEEGYSLASDDLIVPKDARNTALAHKFINFLHDPQVAAENTEYITYLCPNKSSYALLSEEVRSNPGIFAPEQVRKKGEAIRDLGEDNAKYIKIWDQVKAAE